MGAITPDLYLSMGLTHEEYRLLTEQMGREPRMTELGMISVMWSEHCGYKYSRPVLAYFAEYKKAIEGEGRRSRARGWRTRAWSPSAMAWAWC